MIRITDIHTHLLPGIDDGAKDWNTCMKMIRKSWRAGVRVIIATPHFLPWEKDQDPLRIYRLCEEAQKKAEEELGINMAIYPGNEIYYHTDMLENIRKKKALTLAGSRYVLIEFPEDVTYEILFRGIRDLVNAHLEPVIAHVERYHCLRKPGRMEELLNMGARFQMNAGAFQGGFLDETSRWSKKVLQKHQIHFVASDMHNTDTRPPLSKNRLEWPTKKLNETYLKEILSKNSAKIIKNNIHK